MGKNPRDGRPYIRPVTRIELSEKNIRIRWILIAVFLSIAVVSIGMGFYHALNVQPGWNTVTVSSDRPNCGSEFQLMYDFSDYGGNASAVNKRLQTVYSQTCEDAYVIFSPDAEDAGLQNLRYLNDHPNTAVTVEKALYNALELLENHGNRNLYLAPVYVEYNRIFSAESDVTAREYDPAYNPDAELYIRELTGYANNPDMIRLELLGNRQVILHISEDYQAYAEENGIEQFLDFGWMRNAFIADYIADALTEAGFTSGYLASFDGYTRNLDIRGGKYGYNLFDLVGNSVYAPGQIHYGSPVSIVFLRSFPMDELDRWSYYAYGDGSITTSRVDPQDGRNKSSIPALVCYGSGKTCAQILMEMSPVYVSDDFRKDAVLELADRGIHSVWCSDGTIWHTDTQLEITVDQQNKGIVYRKAYAG